MNNKKIVSNLSAYIHMQKQLRKIQDDNTLSDISKILVDDTIELIKGMQDSEFSDSKCTFIINSTKDFIKKIPLGSSENHFYSVISEFFSTVDPGQWEVMDVMLNNLWIIHQPNRGMVDKKLKQTTIAYIKKKCEEITGGKSNLHLIRLFNAVLENGIDFVESVQDNVLLDYIRNEKISSLYDYLYWQTKSLWNSRLSKTEFDVMMSNLRAHQKIDILKNDFMKNEKRLMVGKDVIVDKKIVETQEIDDAPVIETLPTKEYTDEEYDAKLASLLEIEELIENEKTQKNVKPNLDLEDFFRNFPKNPSDEQLKEYVLHWSKILDTTNSNSGKANWEQYLSEYNSKYGTIY